MPQSDRDSARLFERGQVLRVFDDRSNRENNLLQCLGRIFTQSIHEALRIHSPYLQNIRGRCFGQTVVRVGIDPNVPDVGGELRVPIGTTGTQ